MTSGTIKTLTNNKDDKWEVKLKEKIVISPDTIKFRFALPTDQHVLGLPIGQHILFVARIDDKPVFRPYSPVSDDDSVGYFDVVIKVYKKGIHPNFPDGGKMSQHLDSLNIGETITLKGPVGIFLYKGLGEFHVKKEFSSQTFDIKKTYKHLGMLAGGTGITPMLQLATAIFKNPQDTTDISLLFSNHTEDDMLCREELDALVAQNPTRFKVWYTVTNLSKPPSDLWKYSKGRVDAAMIKEHMPAPAPGETFVIICGPTGFCKEAVHPALDTLGYAKEDRLG
jgi:cytochrome-b5 reductase